MERAVFLYQSIILLVKLNKKQSYQTHLLNRNFFTILFKIMVEVAIEKRQPEPSFRRLRSHSEEILALFYTHYCFQPVARVQSPPWRSISWDFTLADRTLPTRPAPT